MNADECLHVAEPGSRYEDEGCSCVEDYHECVACDGTDPDAVCVWFQRPPVALPLPPGGVDPSSRVQALRRAHSDSCPDWCACWSGRIGQVEWTRDHGGEV